jgi:hypothetical protein
MTKYIAMSGVRSSSWHLGSDTRGLRTYCGKLLGVDRVLDNEPSLVNCKTCRKTTDWQYAEIQMRKQGD